MMEDLLKAVLHSFSLSRVSHKGEFYLERFLMRQHCTNNSFILIVLSPLVLLVRSYNLESVISLECYICDCE